LGVGKTTAVLHYLELNAGHEFIAVLTNDFGKIGIDASVIGATTPSLNDALHLVNVPGGCICCTSYAGLESGLEQISRLPKVDRVIIEPSGLTLLQDLAPALEKLCHKFGMEWMPVITMLDPARVRKAHVENLPYFGQLVRHADIIVANRCDRCPPETLAQFETYIASLHPPKLRVLSTEFGRLPQELFNLRLTAAHAVEKSPGHHHHNAKAGGKKWPLAQPFDREALLRAIDLPSVQRFKGIFFTTEGWFLIERASDELYCRPIPASDASQGEWILDPTLDLTLFESSVSACLRRPA
jgi:G3E family GTPase